MSRTVISTWWTKRRRLSRARVALISLLLVAVLGTGALLAGRLTPQPAPYLAESGPLRLRSANALYYLSGPGDPVVEVRVIVENRSGEATSSSSIHWDPAFAQQFTFLDSAPAPWRVRRNTDGWGVLDTAGVMPHQAGTFRLWFAIGTETPVEPRILFVSDGGAHRFGVVTAAANHLTWSAPPWKDTFDQGALGWAARATGVLPVTAHWSFVYATLSGVVLALAFAAGLVAAFRQALPVAGRR